jgi:hypothetical protein
MRAHHPWQGCDAAAPGHALHGCGVDEANSAVRLRREMGQTCAAPQLGLDKHLRTSLVGCCSPPECMERTLLSLYVWCFGLLREVQQARLLHDIGEQHQPGRIGTEDFPY